MLYMPSFYASKNIWNNSAQYQIIDPDHHCASQSVQEMSKMLVTFTQVYRLAYSSISLSVVTYNAMAQLAFRHLHLFSPIAVGHDPINVLCRPQNKLFYGGPWATAQSSLPPNRHWWFLRRCLLFQRLKLYVELVDLDCEGTAILDVSDTGASTELMSTKICSDKTPNSIPIFRCVTPLSKHIIVIVIGPTLTFQHCRKSEKPTTYLESLKSLFIMCVCSCACVVCVC